MFHKLINTLKVTAVFTAVTFFSLAQNPLFIPPVLTGTTFNLNVQADSTEFFSGHKTPTYGVNGNILAPTLILNNGDNITLNVTNNLTTTTTMHWHGLHVPAMDDGGPHHVILPGNTWSPSFTVMNDAATYWYHPHGENKTDIQVTKGLAGMIIIRDSIESAITLPRTYGIDDFPLIIQTKCFDVLYQTAIATVFDTVPMINATINPFLDAPAQVVRLRLLNGSSDRSYLFGFSNNQNFNLITTDGGLLEAPVTLNRLRLSPGERAEVLVDFTAMTGQTVYFMNYGSQLPNGIIGASTVGNGMAQIPNYNLNPLNGADYYLLQLNIVNPTSNPVTTIPTTLRSLSPWNTNQSNRNRTITLAPLQMSPQTMVEGPFTMNNHQFSMNTINDTTYLNHIEVWTINNQTLVAHPFHIHDIQFFITDVNGTPTPAYEQGKKDVVLVMPQQTVSFITKFEDFSSNDPYMYHCHLLHHEDDGMMASFIVLDSSLVTIDEIRGDKSMVVFPNPIAGNQLNIYFKNNVNNLVNFKITNLLGEIILDNVLNITNHYATIDINTLSAGMYAIQINSENKNSSFQFIRK